MSKQDFMNALTRKTPNIPASGSGTSVVTIELMEHEKVYFPDAHLDPRQMAALAMAAHTVYGFDNVMPLFSTWQEASAVGSKVDWGSMEEMPSCRETIFQTDEDIVIPDDFEKRPGCAVPIEAIRILKKELGEDAAVCGKVFGSWTLGLHFFGMEKILTGTLLQPDMIKRAFEKLKEITVRFAKAQIDAGADCLLVGDHISRDLCGPETYRDFLKDIHAELVERIGCPLILHTCGDTTDRIPLFAETGMHCFHWDTKAGTAEEVRKLAGERMALMGGLNNTDVLLLGTPELVREKVEESLRAGIDIVGPECAVGLKTPMKNLEAAGKAVLEYRKNLGETT